jgi:hypothetical protein
MQYYTFITVNCTDVITVTNQQVPGVFSSLAQSILPKLGHVAAFER